MHGAVSQSTELGAVIYCQARSLGLPLRVLGNGNYGANGNGVQRNHLCVPCFC